MKHIALSALIALLIATPASWSQQTNTSNDVKQVTVQKRSISLEAALSVARAGLQAGKAKGANVAVAVVDEAGLPLVVLRADNATEQFVTGAESKAWTAVNLRASTMKLCEDVKKGDEDFSQLPHAEKCLLLDGGVPLKDGETIVGGVGVAGCFHGPDDDASAQAAAAKFAELIRQQ